MRPCVLDHESKAYVNLLMAAQMLQDASPNKKRYKVEEVYFDYGQNWIWTTISREDEDWGGVQVLCPRDFEALCGAESETEVKTIVETIRNDRFFGDK